MIPRLKGLFSLDVDDLESYTPEKPDDFGISIRLMIGDSNSEGAESFDIFVCTPAWITSRLQDQFAFWGGHSLVVPVYDFARIRNALEGMISRCAGSDWKETAQKLSRLGAWEFEDYQPYLGPVR